MYSVLGSHTSREDASAPLVLRFLRPRGSPSCARLTPDFNVTIAGSDDLGVALDSELFVVEVLVRASKLGIGDRVACVEGGVC